MNFSGLITRLMKQSTNMDGVPVRLSNYASLAVAQVESPYQESTRSGRRFHGGVQVLANGVAPVQAIPTTTAAVALFNSDTNNNGLALVVDWANIFLASGTSAAGATVLVAVGKPSSGTAPVASASNYSIGTLSGTAQGSKALFGIGTVFATTPVWSAVASTSQVAGANVGQGDNCLDLGGRIVVPPGYMLGISILSGAGTTPLYGVSLQWAEHELDLA